MMNSSGSCLQVFLVVSFYWSLLGSVYSLQAGYRKMGFYALLSVCK